MKMTQHGVLTQTQLAIFWVCIQKNFLLMVLYEYQNRAEKFHPKKQDT